MPRSPSMPIHSINLADGEVRGLIEILDLEHLGHDDRRRYPRVNYRRIPVLLGIDLPEAPASFLILADNISRGGMAFHHPQPLAPGTLLACKIVLVTGKPIPAEGRVVRCLPIDDGEYEIGAHFEPELDADLVPF